LSAVHSTQREDYITLIGQWLIKMINGLGRFGIFCSDSLLRIVHGRPRTVHISEQMVTIGLDSLPIANLTAFFIGMVMVLNTGYQLAIFGVKDWSAGITAIALTREMVPVFTAVVVGAKVSASIAAELGTMRVTEQIDAMEVNGVNPISRLVVPRVVASFFMLPLISIYSLFIGLFGGMLVGNFALHIPPRQYIEGSVSWLVYSDVYTGIAKTFAFALIISLVGCYHGFNAQGGAAGVGRSTTSAVVASLITILIANYILSTWSLALLGQL
jgi:phospholipid/cholesterol/gamma-HCH transport system permease protein